MAARKQDQAEATILTLVFEHERDTKNKKRFAEVVDGDLDAVGTLYVRQSFIEAMGGADALTVTIAPRVKSTAA